MPTGEPAGSTPNVGLFSESIKGKGAERPAVRRELLFEQLVSSAAVAGGIDHMLLDPGDLLLQSGDPRLKLLDREGAEVLLDELRQRILWAAGKEVILVHGGIVDRWRPHVNKSANGGAGGLMSEIIPDVMRVVEISDKELRLASRPTPRPGKGEVLVKVAAAGVNRPDVVQRKGLYPPPPGASDIPGLEIAGTVVAAEQGSAHLIGSRQCALVAGGGYADYCVAPAGTCLPVPEVLRMTEAAAMPETLFTVWTNLFERGFAADGDSVLVHGGTSGIGTMAIKLGALFGLEVIVTCGSDEKCAAAIELGAAHAINYRTTDFVDAVQRWTEGRGVAVVLDMVGGDYVPRNLQCLADDGRHVSIAWQRGPSAEISIVDVARRRLTLTGSTLRPRDLAFKTMVRDEIAQTVWPYVEGNRLKPVMDECFPLEEAAAAHARMEAGDHIGKIVLTVAP